VHKEFADPGKLRVVHTVLPSLLRWLHAQGRLDTETMEAGTSRRRPPTSI